MIRVGRCWVSDEDWSWREDGFWFCLPDDEYFAWMPRLKFLFVALVHAIKTGENNFFYTEKNRRSLGLDDKEIFQ